jgi:hypothetical protein
MPPPADPSLRQHLAWAYGNLAMAEKALHDGDSGYGRVHYMIRSRIYREMSAGSMSPRSLMRDQKIRMKLPQQCIYCGGVEHLAIDHVVASAAGGADAGDNAVWACRSCNSSKGKRDLFDWWGTAGRMGLPPLFVVRVYLKQAIHYAEDQGLLGLTAAAVGGHPYRYDLLPVKYPPLGELIFTPWHHEQVHL